MRATISGSMDNYMKTLRLRLDKAKAVENRLASSIQAVPKQEKDGIEHYAPAIY